LKKPATPSCINLKNKEKRIMNNEPVHLLLADDDIEDCLLFKEALEEVNLAVPFTAVHDGQQLMSVLSELNDEQLHVLFLDLNMPRKNGFECLIEIKKSDKLKNTPVVIFSTSLDPVVANELYENGAHLYIRKPNEYSKLKKVIDYVLGILTQKNINRPTKEKFVIQL
jgi:CheY-like chemotaxis protein